jgi:GDP-4-dehydro-6-deoxy-D-mannose reductase
MRVWVTGAAGFVGSRLVARLEADGHEPQGSDRELDVSDAAAVSAAVERMRPDAVIHLAAISFVPEAARDPLRAFRVNALGTRNVLRGVAAHARQARVLVIGSSVVYGAVEPGAAPFDESAPLRPEGAYAWTKAAADMLAGEHAREGLDVVRLRPFNHSGAGRPDTFVESSFARQIAEMEAGRQPPVLRVGNLAAIRDFLHVDDVVEAYTRLIAPAGPDGVFNIASGQATRVGALLELLLERSSVQPDVIVESDRWRPADASVGNAGRLQKETGWEPTRTLADTLGELLDEWRRVIAAAPAEESGS